MDSMHPHWQTTDDEQDVPVRITAKADFAPKQSNVPAAKRSPAALFGITLILMTAFFSFGGQDLFSAQVGQPAVDVVISENALTPQTITVRAGQRITWTNTSTIPHILASETLKDEKGNAIETTAIFPGSAVSIDLPASTPAGTYEYVSKTSPSISGTIVVESAVTSTASVSSSAASVSSTTVSSVAVSSASSIAITASSTASMQEVPPDIIDPNGLPVNPYTVGNTYTGPVTKNPTATVTNHRPVTNTQSGAGLWIVALTGLTALLIVMRKASVKV